MKHLLRARGLELGFARVGFCRGDAPLAGADALRAWLGAGMHAGMSYLARDPERRIDPRALLPSAASVVAVAAAYPPAKAGAPVAAYALLADYHAALRERLEALLAYARELDPGVEGAVAVDTKPLLERAAAASAGLGWIGKNSMLLDVEHGPWLMLGALVLSLDLAPDEPEKERCGTCTRCLDACPTAAFVRPYVLDARRCLSYWTIEHRGPLPLALRRAQGTRIFGCDDCLRACPFGTPADAAGNPILPLAPELAALSAREALARAEAGFDRNFKRFAISRAGKAGLIRNCLTALGNGADPEAPELAMRYVDHPDDGVRSHARWVLAGAEAR